ncbi:site-specific DNA-methyltransferase [Thioclava sp. IC9]|nr:site-specific DNA-methyltransferase [Thioclava sp. IC9]
MHSPDLMQDNIAKIQALFPGCVTEARDEDGKLALKVDFDQLRQELSDSIVEGPQERYHLNWPGKREALITANAPIAKTLRPNREESVGFDTTQNLFIEGDNLEALKILQETYLGKVKMIYIDPPYNTGNDFVYDDDFEENISDYFERSNQRDSSGTKLVANTQSNGRFHSDWLSMMYARLKLSKNLLSDDGVIFISIDDGELANLRSIADEIFGNEKFIACFVWKSRQNKDNRNVTNASIDHEYVLCYGEKIRGEARKTEQYTNPDNDPRGPWASANMVGIATADRRPNLHYDLVNPETGINYGCPIMGWRYDKNTMSKLISEDRILWPASEDGRPRRKSFLDDLKSDVTGFPSIIGKEIYTRDGTSDIEALFARRVFDFPKPVRLMQYLVEQGAPEGGIVLDFFSGSSTTAHAVMAQNARDGANRQMISVQIQEALSQDNPNQKTAADFCKENGFPEMISELSKERIRRAGRRIVESQELASNWNKDVGFRVLKIDSSNMADVFYTPDATSQKDLLASVDNIKPDRTPEDLLFQVLVDWGVDLTLPISSETIDGKAVFSVAGTALMACFDDGVDEALVKKLAEREPMRVVFKDTGFKDDATKINVRQIFKSLSPDTEVKAI